MGGVVCYDADFYPYGGERACTNTCPQNYKFEGKERDTETGNDDFGARYYSNRFGRWLSADWSAVPEAVPYANLSNPQTLNLYAMVSDDPESFADLDGHDLNKIVSNLEKSANNVGHALETAGEKVVKAVSNVVNGVGGELGAGAGQVIGGIASGDAKMVGDGANRIGATVVPLVITDGESATGTAVEEGEVGAGEAVSTGGAAESAMPKEGIYEGPAAGDTERTYVGQSGNLPKRVQEQQASGGAIEPGAQVKTTAVPGGKTAREIAEHGRIQELGGVRSTPGSRTSNIRNPIGKKRQHLLKQSGGPTVSQVGSAIKIGTKALKKVGGPS